MSKVDLTQNTPEWHAWRATGLGASLCSAIMGNNPWRSKFRTWQELVGEVPVFKGNAATERGHRLEPHARSLYNIAYGHYSQPACYVYDELPFILASLDGISRNGKRVLEVKCPGWKTFAKIRETREIPAYYRDNCQQQLLCSNADVLDFFVYYPGEEHISIEVFPDESRMVEIVETLSEFWKWVINKEWPGERPDESVLIDDPEAEPIFTKYRELLDERDKLKADLQDINYKLDLYKQQVLDFSDSGNCHGYGLKIVEKGRKGFVDYESLLKSHNISAEEKEKFRKADCYWLEIKVDK